MPTFTPQPQSLTALWPVLISRPRGQEVELAWVAGNVPRWSARKWSPVPVLTGLDVELLCSSGPTPSSLRKTATITTKFTK